MTKQFLKKNRLDKSNRFEFLVFRVDGSELPTGTGTATPLLVGREAATALDDGSNQVTITFNEALPIAPLVASITCGTTDVIVDTYATTTTTLIYTTTDTDAVAAADADVDIVLICPMGPEVM